MQETALKLEFDFGVSDNICLEFSSPFATRENIPQEVLDRIPEGEQSLVYKKEMIPVGTFKKDGYQWTVTEPLLQHWKKTEDRFQEKGITTPVPLEHSFDPQATRGESLGYVVEQNSKGVPALFGYLKFADDEAAKLAKTANVSVFVPPEWSDGHGEHYVRPIKHVALTAYPIIPGLGKFQAIAASFVEGNPDMSIIAIAQQLGIQNPEQMQPEQLLMAVTAGVKGLMDQVRTAEDSPGEVSNQPHPAPGASPAPAPVATAPVVQQPPTPPTHGLAPPQAQPAQVQPAPAAPVPFQKKQYPPALMASFKNLFRDNRTAKIDALASAGNITPAAAADLKALFVKDESLDMAFSSAMEKCECEDADEKGVSDSEFDGMCECMKKNKAIEFSEKTGPQGGVAKLAIAKNDSPLVADAEARRKAMAASN